MIENGNAVCLFRFTEKQWADRFIDGEISFSCPGKFIYQNKITGNEEQGDKLEAVFAKLKKDDERIQIAKETLGRDLEIIVDDETEGEYVYLRRRSAKLKPIFCIYACTAGDLLEDNIANIEKTGWQLLPHTFDDKMYGGFSQTYQFNNVMNEKKRFTQLLIDAKAFIDRIRYGLFFESKAYKMEKLNYDEFKKETFYIEPTNEYLELFYKRPEYRYQHEARIVLIADKFNTINDRYNLKVVPFKLNENVNMSHVPTVIKLEVDIELAN